MRTFVFGMLISSCSLSALAVEKPFSIELLSGLVEQESVVDGYGNTTLLGYDTSFGIRAAYQLKKGFAFEVSYHDYGQSENVYVDSYGDLITDKVSTTAMNAGVKGVVPFDNGFSIHGRVGLSLWDAELEKTDTYYPGQLFKSIDAGSSLYFGAGLQYDITPDIVIGADYSITNMDILFFNSSIDHTVDDVSFSIGYKF